MAENVENWMCDELLKLGIDASEDIARYILGMDSAEEIEEYMVDFLDSSDPRSKRFLKELIVRWRPYSNSKASIDMQVYKKPELLEDEFSGKPKKNKPFKKNDKRNSPTPAIFNGHDSQLTHNRGILPGEERQSTNEKEVKKKQKFVPLFSKEGQAKDVIQVPGRHTCECQAAKHSLVNNCTRCGRVVCQQEGSGPCLFCGNLVCTPEEAEIIARGSKKSEKLRNKLMGEAPTELLNNTTFTGERDYLPNTSSKMKEGFVQAQKHKEKLLDYDKTSVRRTQVIDDEADYFATESKWLSKEERAKLTKREEELRAQKYASRKDRKITLDFAGRRVIEEDASVNIYDEKDSVVQEIHHGARPKTKLGYQEMNSPRLGDSSIVNPNIVSAAPKFKPQETSVQKASSSQKTTATSSVKTSRLQDKELQEMSDEGCCMSMHQPWASLLTSSIKMHEGRTWYTAHRGRLWIAATAKSPDPAEIADVEQTYRHLYGDKHLEFPSSYPVGCLLGCVDVVDCLPQDMYTEKYPEGESGSPFVFICENPHELLVKFPIKGKHKIYKLESQIHKAAKKGLR